MHVHTLPTDNKILFLSDNDTHACTDTHAQRSPSRSPSIFIWVNKWFAWQWVNACALSLQAQMVAQSFALPCFV